MKASGTGISVKDVMHITGIRQLKKDGLIKNEVIL